jgi:hypothetical protein
VALACVAAALLGALVHAVDLAALIAGLVDPTSVYGDLPPGVDRQALAELTTRTYALGLIRDGVVLALALGLGWAALRVARGATEVMRSTAMMLAGSAIAAGLLLDLASVPGKAELSAQIGGLPGPASYALALVTALFVAILQTAVLLGVRWAGRPRG